MLHNPELRLTSRSGQDRSVKRKNYARTTDKGCENRRIYSLISRYNQTKRELRLLMEGLEGLRVGNADALEIRIALTVALLKSSLIDLEARQGDRAQAMQIAA